MRRFIRRFLLVPSAVAATTLLAVPGAHAANAHACTTLGPSMRPNMSVTYEADRTDTPASNRTQTLPAAFELAAPIEPGSLHLCQLRVRNQRDTAVTYDLTTMGVTGGDATNGASVQSFPVDDPRAAGTAASWLTIGATHVRIPPRQMAVVPLLVQVPNDAPAAEGIAAVDVTRTTTARPGTADGPAVGIASGVSVFVFVPVGSGGAPRLTLHRTRAPHLRVGRSAWTLHARINNDGTAHAVPDATVRIRSIFGSTVAELRLPAHVLLPRGAARTSARWGHVPWIGVYRWTATVRDADPRHRAQRDTASGWFIALPPWWVVVVLVAATALMWATRHRHQRRGDNLGDSDLEDDAFDDADVTTYR